MVKDGCNLESRLYSGKIVVFGQSGCTWVKLAVFEQIWMCLGKFVVFGLSGCIWAKVAVFGQIGCYLG